LFIVVTLAGLAAIASIGGNALSQTAPTAPSGEELGHVRYEKAKKLVEPWRAADGSDVSRRAILFQKDLATPMSAEDVDIVATVTIDYRLSDTDTGDIRFDFSPADGGDEIALKPGSFPLSGTNGDLQTRTFVWSKRGVAANGQNYSFQLETGVRDANDRRNSAASSGRRFSVVIEMWPAD
jgi:hypothetical protein